MEYILLVLIYMTEPGYPDRQRVETMSSEFNSFYACYQAKEAVEADILENMTVKSWEYRGKQLHTVKVSTFCKKKQE